MFHVGLALLVAFWIVSPVRAIDLPQGFVDEQVLTDLDSPSGFKFSPDGRLFYAERITGALRVATYDAPGDRWVVARNDSVVAHPLALVLCHWTEDLSWLRYQPYAALVYEKRPELRETAHHSTPRNTANEASAYLQFIVDYYDALPERVAFLHSHRYAYHQEDVLALLDDLDLSTAASYCNVNHAVWGTKEDPRRAILYDTHRAWLEAHLGPLPPLLFDACCAQFLVSRDRIRRRPLAFYQAALAVALDPAVAEHDREANRQLGLVFEWLWHYVFGEPAVAADTTLTPFLDRLSETHLVLRPHHRPACLLEQQRIIR
ncbi:MAG: DUF3431 domain-containing protein [Planctomycetota bacterium]